VLGDVPENLSGGVDGRIQLAQYNANVVRFQQTRAKGQASEGSQITRVRVPLFGINFFPLQNTKI
jgi:hypothetical protein